MFNFFFFDQVLKTKRTNRKMICSMVIVTTKLEINNNLLNNFWLSVCCPLEIGSFVMAATVAEFNLIGRFIWSRIGTWSEWCDQWSKMLCLMFFRIIKFDDRPSKLAVIHLCMNGPISRIGAMRCDGMLLLCARWHNLLFFNSVYYPFGWK